MIRIALLTTLLLLSDPISAVEITNFKYGLACTDGKTFGWICHETSDIYITGQGRCVYNKQEKPCTWHGFSFDYREVTEETEITCSIETSKPTNPGNPEEVLGKGLNSSEYTLPVPLGDGHFINPQYQVLSFDHGIVSEKTICRIDDKVLFEVNRRYIYPVKPLK